MSILLSNAQDMAAINEYMKRTQPVTPEATALRNSWLTWYPALGWWDLNHSTAIRDEASTRRNKFNLANAKTAAEKENVIRVITTGMDTNQMQGKARKPTLPTGEVGTQIKAPTPVTGTHPTIRQGSTGPAVGEWQRILGVTADNKFGPGTKAATISYQKGKGLTPDGVVGPATWSSALSKIPIEATVAPAEKPSLLASILGTKKAAARPASQPAQKPTVQAQIPRPATAAKPSAKPSTTQPTPGSTGTVPASTGAIATVKEKAAVMQAGMLGGLDKLPLWLKVAGGASLVAAIILGRGAKMVNYGVKAQRYRRA